MPKHVICLVDDSKELLHTYSDMFQSLGDVKTFSDPQAFLDYFDANPHFRPDLVVTDLSMPAMNGNEMLMHAQAKGQYFPTLMVSGYMSKEAALNAVENGVWRILEKPAAPKELIETAAELLREHDYHKVRREIRTTMLQLREMFLAFQVLCLDEIDLRADAIRLDPPYENEVSVTLAKALNDLDEKLDLLDKNEKALESGFKRAQRARAA